MVLTNECDAAAPAVRDGDASSGARDTLGLRGAARELDSRPIETLTRTVRESFERACRSAADGALVFNEDETVRSNDERHFETLWGQVRAAQRAGELRAGDAARLTALIVSAIVGAADLAQFVRWSSERGASDVDVPPLLLLDLLGTKRCN